MGYKDTALWKSAFVTKRDDASVEDQQRLEKHYDDMRERVSSLVKRIASDLPHMTVHDVTHLDALWEMASIAVGDQDYLNPAEAFVFGGAILLHDSAMTLAAFPGGIKELKQTIEWQDLFARHSAAAEAIGGNNLTDIEQKTTDDALRLLHAKRAEQLPATAWTGSNGEQMYLIENQQVRNFYGPKIGMVAHSHWWSVAKVEEKLSHTLGALANVTNCKVDLLKVACLLRVSDAMHLDQRRAPSFEYALTQPSGISADHWRFQERMAVPFVNGDALVYTASPPFEVERADAWWTAYDALQMVDRELRDVDRVLRDHEKPPLVVRRVEGAQSPTDLSFKVETSGWTPVDSTIRVSNVSKIVATLGGDKLYGDDLSAPVRELIQNGLDAIVARRKLQKRPDEWGQLKVGLDERDDGWWFYVEDNGVGMSSTVLTGPLIDFGNSFWKSNLAMEEFPGLAAAGMRARGKYGIGFFSVFMLGDHVKLTSQRYDRDVRSAKVLEFKHGLASRANLREAAQDEVPVDGGTRVEVKLTHAPISEYGLLDPMIHRRLRYGEAISFGQLISSIAPATDVNISVLQNGVIKVEMYSRDWLSIESSQLLSRLSARVITDTDSVLSELKDDDGTIYGRAGIRTHSSGIYHSGKLVVDGLAAGNIARISGILFGSEATASRNDGFHCVPPAVLRKWASEQTLLIERMTADPDSQAEACATILACGGEIRSLPIIFWRGDWMSSEQFEKSVASEQELILHEGYIDLEPDTDDVSRSDFDRNFEAARNVGVFFNTYPSDLAAGVENSSTLDERIGDIIDQVWGEAWLVEESGVVGTVNGTAILRTVFKYYRNEADINFE